MEFECVASNADETPQAGESAPAMVERLSRLKATAAGTSDAKALVIAADTDVELDGAILGKPRDAEDAHLMLRTLRDRPHSVFTGITLAGAGGMETEIVHSRVWMRNYTDDEITAYVASGDPLDKAAAYGVQHRAFSPVTRVEGCFANVMGLPLCRLYQMLARQTALPAPRLECLAHPETDCSVQELVR